MTVPSADQINWDNLSPDARWTLKHCARPLLEGADLQQIASETGMDRRNVMVALERLKQELMSQTTTGGVVSYVRPLTLTVEATDMEQARWRQQAAREKRTLESWLRDLANKAAA